MTETTTLPLYGTRTDGARKSIRGLSIKTSDCDGFAPPAHVNEKHRELQRKIDRRKVRTGEVHGYIEHDGERVTDWDVDDDLLTDP